MTHDSATIDNRHSRHAGSAIEILRSLVFRHANTKGQRMIAYHLAHQNQLIGLRFGCAAIGEIMARERNDVQTARTVLLIQLPEPRTPLLDWLAPGPP